MIYLKDASGVQTVGKNRRILCSMPPTVRRSLAAISGALALSALLAAVLRADQAARQDPLLIDFAALGKDGRPLVDLRPEDVTVKIDGKTRPVRSLRLVQVGSPLSASGLPTPFGSNDAAEVGRQPLHRHRRRVDPAGQRAQRQGIAAPLSRHPVAARSRRD
jgi:hypothetical protein